ncbi:PX11B protein, partial [Aegithalos caudatus]|nr:PX11B protein [Aegithalos caudatus]
MEAWVRFSAQSQARERLLRAAQYACILAGAALSRTGSGTGNGTGNGTGSGTGILSRLQQLEAHLSLGRKRIPCLPSAGIPSLFPVFPCFSPGISRCSLFFPSLFPVFPRHSQLFPAIPSYSQVFFPSLFPSFPRYYLFSLLLNLTRDAYELRLLLERAESSRLRGKSPDPAPHPRSRLQHLRLQLLLLLRVLRDNPPVLLDLLRNAWDLVIPLEKLGMCRSSPGMVGLCGLASSVLAVLTILHPWLRLKP